MRKYVLPGFNAESSREQIVPSSVSVNYQNVSPQIRKGSNLDLCLEICETNPKPINCARRCIDLYGNNVAVRY
jgi:hypothetical protein